MAPAAPSPSLLSRVQAPLQDFLRPAMWIPGMRMLRYAWEEWEVKQMDPDACRAKMVDVLRQLQLDSGLMGYKLKVVNPDGGATDVLTVRCFSPTIEFLDVVEVSFAGAGLGTCVRVRSFSTGLAPTLFPLAPLLSAVFFWVPFMGNDSEGMTNPRRVRLLREAFEQKTGSELVVTSTSST
eukprot:m.5788 g.5788  ORF g.5788 m.5788 type:complete len:181 (+) comp2462_c0_seq1:270-812(+)